MRRISSKISIAFILGILMALAIPMTAGAAPAQQDGCIIPESGPWPPCATGGEATDSWNEQGGGDHSDGGNADGCVIPESGPWPPCATGGSGGGNTGGGAGAPCPESGVWPPGCTPSSGGQPAPAPAPAPAPEQESAPAPAPAPEQDDEIVVIDFITLVYRSNPDEVLGVFPVVEFNRDLLIAGMIVVQVGLDEMQSNLDGAKSGDAASCQRYIAAYETVMAAGIFHAGVPAEWQRSHDIYAEAFILSLDRTRPAYLSCFDSGQVDQFNYGLAWTTIDEVRAFLEPAIREAIGRL